MPALQTSKANTQQGVTSREGGSEFGLISITMAIPTTDPTNANPNNYFNDPLHLASSDHPRIVLTNIPFNGGNFLRWSRNVKMARGAKLKLGFIDGSCPKPVITDENVQRWVRCNYMVTCWILNSMVTELSEAFLYVQTAYELWKDITERYGQSNGPLIYQLERELSKITQVEILLLILALRMRLEWVKMGMLIKDPIMVPLSDGRSLKVTIVKEVALTPSLILSGVFYSSLNGALYFFTIVDDNTRATWTYLVHSKDQIPTLLVSFLAYVENHFKAKPKFIRMDNGTEVINRTCVVLFKSKGIIHQRSMAYTPQQNGVVEKKHMHLLDTARSLRVRANLLIKF
uniref:Integrase catalytic domain-containing protein n=1 Tax=Tanacetum cinerariifolium TaxID=118510 RepID=A0A699HYF7_TANCI|nr:hypothetical protein [Tanacetum cinerariifolium]